MDSVKEKAVTGLAWRIAQNFSRHIITFVLSIILARLLSPYDYGLLAMVTVFTNIAMVFINVGFTSALIQKENLSDDEINAVFSFSIVMSITLYAILYFVAPLIADFYGYKELIALVKVESLVIVIGAIYSVPLAMISRSLEYKKSFYMSIFAAIAQGGTGIVMAMKGYGVWALVLSTLVGSGVSAIFAWYYNDRNPKLKWSTKALKGMNKFSVQMLFSSLLDTFFNNVRSIIIGKQYSSDDLAYYNRGYQFPAALMTQIDGALSTVLFSTLSKYQNKWDEGIFVLRRAIKTSMYICTPLMLGLYAVSEPVVMLLLTDKWAASIEYMKLVSLVCITWPLASERHSLNAIGMPKAALMLNVLDKSMLLLTLYLTFRYSIKAMIVGTVVVSWLSQFVSMFFYRKYLKYKIKDQVKDLMPSILLSVIMCSIISLYTYLNIPYILMLILQIVSGIAIYWGLSVLTHQESYYFAKHIILDIFVTKFKAKRK